MLHLILHLSRPGNRFIVLLHPAPPHIRLMVTSILTMIIKLPLPHKLHMPTTPNMQQLQLRNPDLHLKTRILLPIEQNELRRYRMLQLRLSLFPRDHIQLARTVLEWRDIQLCGLCQLLPLNKILDMMIGEWDRLVETRR